MMWKDSYRLGVERIDHQHIELFRMTEELVNAGKNGAEVETYQKILAFLKDYVIYHFRDEEAYQESVHYNGLAAHKREHRQFTQTVLSYEKQLTENGFDQKTVKDLAGTVTAWLIYHVVDTDQEIVSGKKQDQEDTYFDQYVDLFYHSALDVMETMAGLNRHKARMEVVSPYQPQGDLFVSIQLVGDLKGEVVFGFSKELALHLLETMTGMEQHELDELVQSALCELTNIACGNAATALVKRGLSCDIKTPQLSLQPPCCQDGTGVRVDTGSGMMSVGVLM